MRKCVASFALTVVSGVCLATACSSSPTNATDAGSTVKEAGVDAPSEAAPSDDGGGSDAGGDADGAVANPAYLRLANWSPDAMAVDFCVAPHGSTSFQGPQLAQAFADAGAAGLTFPQVSAFVQLAPGQYDVRLVAAGATSCATGMGSDLTSLPALAAGAYETVAAVGDVTKMGSDPALSLVAFGDDSAVMNSQDGSLRFIDASPSIAAADFGRGSVAGATFQTFFTNVAFASASSQADTDAGTVDGAGFMDVAPFGGGTLSTHPTTGGGNETVGTNVAVNAGDLSTFVLVNGKTGGPAPQLLQCYDSQADGMLTHCKIVSQ